MAMITQWLAERKEKVLLKIVLYSVLILILPSVLGCSLFFSDEEKPSQVSSIYEKKLAASNMLQKAQDEFFEGIPTTLPSDVNTPEQWGLKDRLIAEAGMAYFSGDTSKIEKLLKDNNLYEKFEEILKKYNIVENREILAQPSGLTASGRSRAVVNTWFDSCVNGDILLCYGGDSSGWYYDWLFGGHWKHAGLFDKANSYNGDKEYDIVSASLETTSGQSVGYETRAKWVEESAVQEQRVRNSTSTQRSAALSYAKTQIGKPMDLFATRESNDTWYCSKLAYRSYLTQGFALEPTPWWGDNWVTAQDLVDDDDTYYVRGDKN
jgi:hypothetical protein